MIYTPRISIDMLDMLPQQKNKQVCTKIEYKVLKRVMDQIDTGVV